jgi:GTP cyclohydrolase I
MNARSPPVHTSNHLASSPKPVHLDRQQSSGDGELAGISEALDRIDMGPDLQNPSSRRSSGSGSDGFKLSRNAPLFQPRRPSSSSSSNAAPLPGGASRPTPDHIHLPTHPFELKPRQPLEGYGFRPRSGASTPIAGLSSPSIPQPFSSHTPSTTGQASYGGWNGIGFPGPSRNRPSRQTAHEEEVDYAELQNNDLLGMDEDGFPLPASHSQSRPQSNSQTQHPLTASEIADSEGLGWPAKLTHQRLHASPEEQSANLLRLSGAVRTVLECIGEDPDREGLERTPERYAKALLWMTKGYEERLSGEFPNGEGGMRRTAYRLIGMG